MGRSLILLSVLCVAVGAHVVSILSNSPADEQAHGEEDRLWRRRALELLWKERATMKPTPIYRIPLAGYPKVDIYFKNETTTPTKTAKHRFAWALIFWAVTEGKITKDSHVFEGAPGSAAVAQAYFLQLIGIPYTAVVAYEIEPAKKEALKRLGASIIETDAPIRRRRAAEEAAKQPNSFFLNQAGNAAYADQFYDGDIEVASMHLLDEFISQLSAHGRPRVPEFFVHSASTGAAISSAGRLVARRRLPTRTVLADPEFSLYHDYVVAGTFRNETGRRWWAAPGVSDAGFGYDMSGAVLGETTSLVPTLIDQAIKVPDAATVGAMRALRARGVDVGPAAALHFLVALRLAHTHSPLLKNRRMTIGTVITDPGYWYDATYYNDAWLKNAFSRIGGAPAIECWKNAILGAIDHGRDAWEAGTSGCGTLGAPAAPAPHRIPTPGEAPKELRTEDSGEDAPVENRGGAEPPSPSPPPHLDDFLEADQVIGGRKPAGGSEGDFLRRNLRAGARFRGV